ncbi:MAG: aldehyde dehydrogenase family protein, partial [Flavisolibacter sp.]|nr:aldehyde dehydrogenase family protein [Flavisolibacter sp.]
MDIQSIFKTSAFINGAWINNNGRSVFDVFNPSTGEKIAAVSNLDQEDVKNAIDAAHEAWPAYSALTAKDRSAILRRWFDLVMVHKEQLAYLMTLESGKVIAESLGEVNYGAA